MKKDKKAACSGTVEDRIFHIKNNNTICSQELKVFLNCPKSEIESSTTIIIPH